MLAQRNKDECNQRVYMLLWTYKASGFDVLVYINEFSHMAGHDNFRQRSFSYLRKVWMPSFLTYFTVFIKYDFHINYKNI